jgi:hypothetical protein
MINSDTRISSLVLVKVRRGSWRSGPLKEKRRKSTPSPALLVHAAKLIYLTALNFCFCREQLASLLGKYDGIVDGQRHRDGRISFEEFMVMFGELVRVRLRGLGFRV